MKERYELTIARIREIINEKTVAEKYCDYFQRVARFILEIDAIKTRLESRPNSVCTLEELQRENQNIYSDVVGHNYENSYANPTYAVGEFGEEVGQILSFLYAEIRGEIPYVYEERLEYLAICNELFVEIYNCFEGVETPDCREIKNIIYWYASDYCDEQ